MVAAILVGNSVNLFNDISIKLLLIGQRVLGCFKITFSYRNQSHSPYSHSKFKEKLCDPVLAI